MFFYVQSYILCEQFRNVLPVASVEKEHEVISKGNALEIHPVW
jgi:hypothetical protein